MTPDSIRIAGAQIAPVWLDRTATLAKVVAAVHRAADDGAQLVAFGEALVPGYPFWIELTDGARFDAPVQKRLHAHYLEQAVQIEAGHLQSVCDAARDRSICVILGIIERPSDRGGHSIYASLVYIDAQGVVRSVHRKLMPTYEERLSWAPGDGHGLRTHALGAFTVGALNCWENWMPLARASLYAQGEDLHVAIWPGSVRNTEHITRFIARESRSYVGWQLHRQSRRIVARGTAGARRADHLRRLRTPTRARRTTEFRRDGTLRTTRCTAAHREPCAAAVGALLGVNPAATRSPWYS